MELIFLIFSFVVFLKLFLFWLWLWQLKEYHIGRFLAHFESQKTRKIISSFWRIKYPKFTKKTAIIFGAAILFGLIWSFYFNVFWLVVFAPIISSLVVLFFQIPTVILRGRIIQKAKKKREQFKDLLVVGVTGSYGKTSTKEFLYLILKEKFGSKKVLKTKEHQNSEIGISQCILNDLNENHEIFIVEMGAYNKGGIKFLCNIIKPKIGIVTGVNEQHLSTFGKMENLLSAEGGKELVESLPEDGMIFLNGKNKYCRDLYQKIKIKKFLYGENAPHFGIENILGAVAVAKELGMKEEEVNRAAGNIENKLPGIQIKKGINGLKIIDATYSANPDSVISHLEYFKNLTGKKIIIMPCLIELGGASIEVHKRIGKKIGEVCDLAIIITKDKFKEIKETVGEKAVFIENSNEIFKKINDFCKPGDIVFLESRLPKRLIKQLIINN